MPAANFDSVFLTTGMDDKVAATNDLHTKALGRLSDYILDAGTFSDADTTVTDDEATENGWFDFDGTITAARTITFPTAFDGAYWVRNSTTGAFALRVEVSGGTADAIVLPRDSWIQLRHDGTNFAEISRNLIVLSSEVGSVNTMDSAPLEFVSPVEGRLHRVDSIITTVLAASACVITTQIATVTITNGGFTIGSAAAVGTVDSSGDIEDGQAAPNTLAVGDRIQITSDGVPASGAAKFFISIEPRIV